MKMWLLLLMTGMAVATSQPAMPFKPSTGKVVQTPGVQSVQPKFPPAALAAWKNLLLAMGNKPDDAYLMSSEESRENASTKLNKPFDDVARYLRLHPTTFKQIVPWRELRNSPTSIAHTGIFQVEGSNYLVLIYALGERTLLDITLTP